VLDWTQIEVSDARFDLAWTLVLMGSMAERDHEVVLHEYERQAGEQVEGPEWFDVAACLKRPFSVIISMDEGAEKLGMRPGAEAQMREHAGPLRGVCTMLRERTQENFPEIERFLATL